MFGGPLSFLKFFVCLGDCSLHEVLQEVGFCDRVDDVLSVRTATIDTFSKQDAGLDND